MKKITPKESIGIIEAVEWGMPVTDRNEGEHRWELMEPAKEAAIKALQKQIPMRVEEIYVDEYICPSCGETNVCEDGPGLIGCYYCPVCGQRIFQN